MFINRNSRVVKALLGIAVALIVGAAADLFSAGRLIFGMALVCLVIAYFVVLAENWNSGRSVQTRGGIIDKSTAPVAYLFIYVILAVAGLIALVVFLSAFVLWPEVG